MDTFETFVGYRSLLPPLLSPEKQAIEHLSTNELRKLAYDLFDARLAETLRSAGQWHWKLESDEVAEWVAGTLSFGESERYAWLCGALQDHYKTQYHTPTEKEWRSYLRRQHKFNIGVMRMKRRKLSFGFRLNGSFMSTIEMIS